MRDIERLTILGGHVRAVSAAVDRLTQELDIMFSKDPQEARKLLYLVIELAFTVDYLSEEFQAVAETLLSSFKIPA
ncbi:hypothetical protein [Desulfurobacterium sp.]